MGVFRAGLRPPPAEPAAARTCRARRPRSPTGPGGRDRERLTRPPEGRGGPKRGPAGSRRPAAASGPSRSMASPGEPGSGRTPRDYPAPLPRGALGHSGGHSLVLRRTASLYGPGATARQFPFPRRSYPQHGVGQRGRCWRRRRGRARRFLFSSVGPGPCRGQGGGGWGRSGGAGGEKGRTARPGRARGLLPGRGVRDPSGGDVAGPGMPG